VLGLYYLSMERTGEKGEGTAFRDISEVQQALDAGAVSMHAKIKTRWKSVDADGKPSTKVVETTPGRMLLADILPDNPALSIENMNKVLTKKEISGLIDTVYRNCGQKETVIFCDRLMSMGFSYATRAGISFGKDDMIIPPEKAQLVAEAERKVKEYEQQYLDGLITQGEKYNKVVDAWSECTDKVAEEMMKAIQSLQPGEPINAVYMMAH